MNGAIETIHFSRLPPPATLTACCWVGSLAPNIVDVHESASYLFLKKIGELNLERFEGHDDLIFDVGMNHGADAAYYCSKGFRVLSIEANPDSVEIARGRYGKHFSSGQLHVVNVALAEESGSLTLHVCNEESGKSTTSAKLARELKHVGFSFKTVEVPARHIGDILREWGVPYYMKIDIEGYDQELVRQLKKLSAKPKYISVEIDIYLFDGLVDLLLEMGYTEFQVVSQSSVPMQREPQPPKEGKAATPNFSLGNSGLFGKELPDFWTDGQTVRKQVSKIRSQHRALRGLMKIKRTIPVDIGISALSQKLLPQSRDWYDVHAR